MREFTMPQHWLIESAFILIYGIGFLGPMAASGWRALATRFLICLAITGGLIYLAGRGGGFAVLALLFPITLFAVGALSGSATRAALFGLGWGAKTGKGVVAIVIGLLALPAAQMAHGFYRQANSRAIYAALPTAHALPMIPACAPFRETGPMIETVMTVGPSEPRPRTIPTADIPVLYPAVYREPSPPAFPQNGEKWRTFNFEMYISDAQPAPPGDDDDAEGKMIPLDKRRPSINFYFASRPSIAAQAVRLLNITSGKIGELDDIPNIQLAPSSYPGLSLVVAPQPDKLNQWTKSFVAMRGSSIEELVQCSGAGTFPHCSFALDEGEIPIEGSFPQRSLADWPRIRSDLRNFASCSIAAAASGAG
jgi:hypothetical protein